jgi:xanthine/CO dehydrogenase XdhC/CoxF family maturation factor
MTDLDQILPLWQELREAGTEYVLATVVAVDGSGYRKPGARMLIAADGRRAGTISGGCLEGEVARKAFWRTENGPVVRRYSTIAEDGEVPYGMGCGGVVHLLLERSETAELVMRRLAGSFADRVPLAIATVLDGEWIGYRAFWPSESGDNLDAAIAPALADVACEGFEEQQSLTRAVRIKEDRTATVRVEWNAARPGLFVFGAGDDAIPLVRQARQLGWYVAVADGRSNLATRARFPEAHNVQVLAAGEFPELGLRPTDASVVMTHSLEQDTRILAALLAEELAYIGVLGPRRRTDEILLSLAGEYDLPESHVDAQMETWMERLHAPMGLDLGGSTSAEIALAVIAEIQQYRHRASGLALRVIRARDGERRRVTA